MILKTKTPRFKDAGGGELNTGGAPIFADDILRLQENNRADILNENEYFRRRLPLLGYFAGVGNPPAPQHEGGLILSGCEYDNSVPTLPVINPGFILSGGEICFYPGGSYVGGLTAPLLIYLRKGAEVPVNRVFNDGGNKEILTSFTCDVLTSYIGAQGPIKPAGILATDEVVVIACGLGSGYAENYCTKEAAMGINGMGGELSTSAWVPVTSVATGIDVTSGGGINQQGVWSRVKDGFTEVVGSFVIDFTVTGYASPILFSLASHAITGSYTTPLDSDFQSVTTRNEQFPCGVGVNLNGTVRFSTAQAAGLSGATTERISINARVWGNQGIKPTNEFTYKSDFLNLT